jgi:hypothetical protein
MSRQQAALAAKLPALMNNNEIEIRRENGSNQARVEQDGKRVLKLGLDLHYRQVTVAVQEDGGQIKVAGKMSHEVFAGWIATFSAIILDLERILTVCQTPRKS